MTSQTYFCGPTPLARAIKEACVTNKTPNVNFTFYKVSRCLLSAAYVKSHICI